MTMMSIGGVTITLSRFANGGVRVDTYKDLEHMLEELLMKSGDKIPYLVRDEILPKAIKAWDEAKHKEEHPSCNRHNDCNGAEASYRQAHPEAKFIPYSFHCHDECCEDCFGS